MLVHDDVKDALIRVLSECIADGIGQLCTGALLKRPAGTLIVRRALSDDYLPGLYELPGGGMEQGESIVDCLRREMVEETSVIVTHIDALCPSFDYTSSSGRRVRQINFVVRGDGEIRLEPSEHDSLLYISKPSDLDGLQMSSESRRVLVEALRA
ncbi:MAG: NUDIX domain-containing protein [Patescibacteria group bacterium]